MDSTPYDSDTTTETTAHLASPTPAAMASYYFSGGPALSLSLGPCRPSRTRPRYSSLTCAGPGYYPDLHFPSADPADPRPGTAENRVDSLHPGNFPGGGVGVGAGTYSYSTINSISNNEGGFEWVKEHQAVSSLNNGSNSSSINDSTSVLIINSKLK
jgi:hypothetical protein